MSNPSVMTKNFSRIPSQTLQRSVFNRTHGHKSTHNAGPLYPIFVDEILPGDTMSLNATIFARLASLEWPLMDNIFVDTFWFFVPNRLLWDNWERFQGAQTNPGDSTDFLIPTLDAVGEEPVEFEEGSIYDYFGLPTKVMFGSNDYPIALPFRAYNLIWNEWFRDENLQDSAAVLTYDGPDDLNYYELLYRGKRHDYFTSSLPWPQKGDAISIPIGTTAPVIGNGETIGFINNLAASPGQRMGLASINGSNTAEFRTTSYGTPVGTSSASGSPVGSASIGLTFDASNSGLVADLSDAVAATINDLREAFAFQQVLELDARGGTRYVESLKAMWGVDAGDYRLQRPEYLGGSSERIDIRAVAQTSAPETGDPLGRLSSYGQVGTRARFHKSFVEHGFVIGLINYRADITYQQGLRRMWSRRTRFDMYMPPLAHLGEQAVLNKEIYYTDSPGGEPLAVNNEPWGYQERWAEYRYFPSQVTGQFRSNAAQTLDAWHLALNFTAQPLLNDDFIVDDPPIDRAIAVTAEAGAPQFLMDSYIQVKHARPMPVYSVPGLQRL